MGNLARALQQRFRKACPAGWRCTFEERIMSPGLERMLGFAPRADVLLTREDGPERLWIEFEISRADPVANHAKFATAHLFEPRPPTDAFVSMVSSHVTRGRSNLAASAVYLMRSIGMSAFQTSLLPTLEPELVHQLNQRPLDELLGDSRLVVEPEIDRALWVARRVGSIGARRIHYAANLLEVMLNAKAWNDEVTTPQGAHAWGRRTVTYFVHDPNEGSFAPSKFCAFVPIDPMRSSQAPTVSMDMRLYASLDESETRFDGNVARQHLIRRLSMIEEPIAGRTGALARAFARWHEGISSTITLHPQGPTVLMPARY